MERSLLGAFFSGAAAATVLLGLAWLYLSLEHKVAPQAPASAGSHSSLPERKATEPAALLEFPLPYTATITQYGDGIKEPRTRFYVPKERK